MSTHFPPTPEPGATANANSVDYAQMSANVLRGFSFPPVEAVLTINEQLSFQFNKMPSAWNRFWMRTLLGWKWSKPE